MPIKPHSAEIYDTSADYKKSWISYGGIYFLQLTIYDDTYTWFNDGKLTGYAALEEINLIYCKYLNLSHSSIVHLDMRQLIGLRVLILENTRIWLL